jgi:hypothetical protein
VENPSVLQIGSVVIMCVMIQKRVIPDIVVAAPFVQGCGAVVIPVMEINVMIHPVMCV